MTAYVWSTEIA